MRTFIRRAADVVDGCRARMAAASDLLEAAFARPPDDAVPVRPARPTP
ncbi:hypothetical protein [Streptomyces hilarionis]|nr:hypothetical protein [Streptomyces hilarionis]MCQ9134654.1 hypothetical protein [Streptomyces hilarionis]